MEAPGAHQAGSDAGGRLVRHRRPARSPAAIRVYGDAYATRRGHAGDRALESWGLCARRWRSSGQRQLWFEDRPLLPRTDRIPLLWLLLEGQRRRQIPQGMGLPDRSESVAALRYLASTGRKAHQHLSGFEEQAIVAATGASRLRRV